MSIGSKVAFLALYFRTKHYLFKEQMKVIFNFYKNIRFLFFDALFFLFYFPFNPYRISRQFLKRDDREEKIFYGETPLSSYERMAKECQITSSDIFFEFGAGRGRGAFWLSFFIGCRVVAIEWIPLFVKIGKALGFFFRGKAPSFHQEDFLQTDCCCASVIYLYGTCLKETEILQLIQKFCRLSKGCKIITISFPLTDYAPHSFVLEKSFSLSFPWGETEAFLQTPANPY